MNTNATRPVPARIVDPVGLHLPMNTNATRPAPVLRLAPPLCIPDDGATPLARALAQLFNTDERETSPMRKAARFYDVKITMLETYNVFIVREDLPVDEIKLNSGLVLQRFECLCPGSAQTCQRWLNPGDIVDLPDP